MKDIIKNASKRTLALIAAGLLVLSISGIMTARAALNIVSSTYDADIRLAEEMNITILEGKGDAAVDAGASSAVLNALKGSDGKTVNVVPGKVYDETLSLKNNSSRPMYVRLIVRKYWTDKDGNKGTNLKTPLDPSLIRLSYQGSEFNSDDWIRNDNESTAESDTYYYKSILTDTTAPLFDGVYVDRSVLGKFDTKSTEKNGKNVTTYTYQYDGCSICLEVEAQAVQTHNAADAIKSVWGVDASLSGSSIESVR